MRAIASLILGAAALLGTAMPIHAQTIILPAHQMKANVEFAWPGTQVPPFNSITVQLTDPNGQYPLQQDPTRHILIWGGQWRPNSSAVWNWGPIWQGGSDPNQWLPFGSRDRSGNMPALRLSGTDFFGTPSTEVRLAIVVDSPIKLGATVTIE